MAQVVFFIVFVNFYIHLLDKNSQYKSFLDLYFGKIETIYRIFILEA